MSDPNEARFDAVRKYLTDNFPEADIPPPSDFEGAETARVFYVQESYEIRQLELGRSVYENRSVAQLATLLEAHTVAETMQMNPERRLLIAAVWDGRVACSLEDLRA